MSNLNKEIKIAGKKIKNRICMPPMVCFEFNRATDGFATQMNVDHYEKRAAAGTGLIVVEAASVSLKGRGFKTQLGIYTDEHIKPISKIPQACHKHGSVVMLQIHHGGSTTNPEYGEAVAPSDWKRGDVTARELSIDEIKEIEKDFTDTAIRAQKAGFDGVQLHGCHTYLLNSFSSAKVNKRKGKYGGNAENRTRLACDIIKGIRRQCGEKFIISIRMAGNDPTIQDGIKNAVYYINSGIDMISVSAGIGPIDEILPPEDFPFSPITWLGVNMKKHYPQIPVAAVYGITTKKEAELLSEYVDFVCVGKGMLADGDWSASALSKTPLKYPCRKCKRCMWFSDYKKCPARKG